MNNLKRILNIDYSQLGQNENKELSILGYEYLRRISNFVLKNTTKNYPLMFTSVKAILMKDDTLINQTTYINKHLTKEQQKNLNCSNKQVLENYLWILEYSKQIPYIIKYLDIYEPLIKLMELHGQFYINNLELEIKGVCYIPIVSYCSRFKDIETKDISML